MTRQERLLRLARLRGDRAAVLILTRDPFVWCETDHRWHLRIDVAACSKWTEAELRAAWGDR